MGALVEVIPALLLLTGIFWLGRWTGRKPAVPIRDPLPIIQAARHVIVAKQLGERTQDVAVQQLELALDEWDLKRLD